MKKKGFGGFIRKIEQATAVRAIRGGLVSMIPVLIIGAFALIFKTFPVTGYQDFIATFANGFFLHLFDLVYSATFGVLSVYMTFFISRAFMKIKGDPDVVSGGAVAASLLAFFIVSGAYLPGFGTENMGPKSMFMAIITGLGASSLYLLFSKLFNRRRKYLFSSGADHEFNRMVSSFAPILVTAVLFAIFNEIVIRVFNVDSFRNLLVDLFNALFSHIKTGFFKGMFFVFLSSVLWFFGIHGSDTLESVMQTYFAPGLAANQAAVAAGTAPTEILTKQLFDCFVLMGGCGSTICLLIAILIFSKNRARRGLGYTAAFPMIFNINELMVFGLPIIFNPVMLIPFLLVPLVNYTSSYIALSTGLVPMITHEVEWTTPIILGGLRATGSPAGAILQLVNVLIGIMIYFPFVRLLDKQQKQRDKEVYDGFISYFKANESEFYNKKLIESNSTNADFAKGLCADLRHNMAKNLKIAYQPQYNYEGECVGVEALLRWEHPIHGILYPPVVVKLADDGGFLPDFEESVVKKVLSEREKIFARFGDGIKISFNITGTTVVTPRFMQFMRQLNEKYGFAGKNLCIEITEQAALSFNDDTKQALNELRGMGLMLAIDDFSMGQTSLHYLKDNIFNIVKLDGSLIRGLSDNSNYKNIISSIITLSDSLDLLVLAEYVETEEQKNFLHENGCNCYQGYLYSPAVFLD